MHLTPDSLKELFNGYAILIMFAWGLLCKYSPWFARVPNDLIPWINSIGYILVRLVAPAPAAAGALDAVPEAIGLGLGAFTNAVWARQLYEGFVRAWIEGWLHPKRKPALKIKKAR